MKFGLETA